MAHRFIFRFDLRKNGTLILIASSLRGWSGLPPVRILKKSLIGLLRKVKKTSKNGVFGPFSGPNAKIAGPMRKFIIKQPQKIFFWDISYYNKPTGTLQRA